MAEQQETLEGVLKHHLQHDEEFQRVVIDRLALPLTQEGKPRWHGGKEVPIAIICTLLIQTVGVIWLAATTVARVEFLRDTMTASLTVQANIDKRQDDEMGRSEARLIRQLDSLNAKLDRIIEIGQTKK